MCGGFCLRDPGERRTAPPLARAADRSRIMSTLQAPESPAHGPRESANLAPTDGTVPPRRGLFKGRASRWTAGIALGVVWLGLGWWLGLDVVGFILLAVGLIMIFQVAVRRRPLRQLWARDTTTFARHVPGKLGVAAVLVLTVALMVAEAVVQGTYVDTGWTALVMAVVLVAVYVVGRRLLVALTVGALVVVAAAVIMAPRLATDRAGDARLTAELEGLQSNGYLDGMQDLVVVKIDSSAAEPTRQATVGRLSGTTPMEVGSFTKALTGLAVADSVQRGELAMNATVSTYLPELTGTAAGTATIHDLVTHRAGYPEFDTASFRRAAWRAPIGGNFLAGEVDAVLAAAATAELDAPGTYKYSTLGAAVAGQAAARAAGLTYPDLMRTRLFEPLGMTHTAVQTETAPVDRRKVRSGAACPAVDHERLRTRRGRHLHRRRPHDPGHRHPQRHRPRPGRTHPDRTRQRQQHPGGCLLADLEVAERPDRHLAQRPNRWLRLLRRCRPGPPPSHHRALRHRPTRSHRPRNHAAREHEVSTFKRRLALGPRSRLTVAGLRFSQDGGLMAVSGSGHEARSRSADHGHLSLY